MASRATLVQSFNDMLRMFSRDISTAYGAPDNDLQALHNSLVLLSSTMPEQCERLFYENVVLPYGARMEARDETFFLSDAFADDAVRRDTGVLQVDTHAIILQLRKVWATLPEGDRESVWKYLLALTVLCKRIHSFESAKF